MVVESGVTVLEQKQNVVPVQFKIEQEDTKRVAILRFERIPSFADVESSIRARFKIAPDREFDCSFLDRENDSVIVACDDDVFSFLSLSTSRRMPRLYVTITDSVVKPSEFHWNNEYLDQRSEEASNSRSGCLECSVGIDTFSEDEERRMKKLRPKFENRKENLEIMTVSLHSHLQIRQKEEEKKKKQNPSRSAFVDNTNHPTPTPVRIHQPAPHRSTKGRTRSPERPNSFQQKSTEHQERIRTPPSPLSDSHTNSPKKALSDQTNTKDKAFSSSKLSTHKKITHTNKGYQTVHKRTI
ncbi:hypothetical protein BLNAU_22133 [Blattamonas nauphoetae]|uniref:PB1 domain-containing protein n=1 Tax=Blattamonas nauphoetae TaxID=2049346 RepID=A0ABQ9WTV1_9EUKA|nr:hypothetical protein BLNAU_22133 [Blattamonas nauphoetae]